MTITDFETLGVIIFALNFNEISFASISTIYLYDQTPTHHLPSKIYHFLVLKLRKSFSDLVILSPFFFFCDIYWTCFPISLWLTGPMCLPIILLQYITFF